MIGVILGAIAAAAAIAAFVYQRRSYQLQVELAAPKPNVTVYIRTRGDKLTEPVIMWQQPLNAHTSPRAFAVLCSNTGSAATGGYRLSLYAPPGITFAPSSASGAIGALQLGIQPLIIDGREYSEAYFDSIDGIQIAGSPLPLCQGSVIGKCGTVDSIIWRFRAKGYETEGRIKVHLN